MKTFAEVIERNMESYFDDDVCVEMLFGVPWKHVGIKEKFCCGNPQVITYAVTVIFHHYHHGLVCSYFNYVLCSMFSRHFCCN